MSRPLGAASVNHTYDILPLFWGCQFYLPGDPSAKGGILGRDRAETISYSPAKEAWGTARSPLIWPLPWQRISSRSACSPWTFTGPAFRC